MDNMTIKPGNCDFSGVKAAMQRYVDQNLLPGVSYAILQGRELIETACVGWADKERGEALRPDHVFRVFSNSKLVTTCAVLLLWEEGRFQLDDPVDRFLPALADRQVLKPGATSLRDTEPAKSPITVRHLLSHSAGLGYGLLDPGSVLFQAYNQARVLDPGVPLSGMLEALAPLPLNNHPGTAWEYSVATDVLGRLVEVVSGQTFESYLQSRILGPLGMVDTGFSVPEQNHRRLASMYVGADRMNPMVPGLTRSNNAPYPGEFLTPVPRQSGGWGLVSTLPDMVALVRSLLPGGPTLLKPETLALMMCNQLPPGVNIRFPMIGDIPGKGFGLGGAVTMTPSANDPQGSEGEFQWGGIAGTHWWISPKAKLAAVVMTQRQMAFWHPFSFEFKQRVCAAVQK